MGPREMRMGSGEGSKMSLYRSPNIVRLIKSRRLRWVGHVARMEKGRSTSNFNKYIYGKRPLGRPRHRWEANIRMDLKEIVINMRNWVDWCRDYWRVFVNTALILRVP